MDYELDDSLRKYKQQNRASPFNKARTPIQTTPLKNRDLSIIFIRIKAFHSSS